jgi:nucleoside-diphosphate-sugar epimerase
MPKEITIIGCGWLGLPLASNFIAGGYQVFGTTTSKDKQSRLADSGIVPVMLMIDADGLECSDHAIWNADIFVIAVPPKVSANGVDYHVGQVATLLRYIPEEAGIIYVSSTSVYPSMAGIYDELFPMNLELTGNPTLYQAEQLISDRSNSAIVRPGGLMGEGRVSGRYFAGKEVSGENQPVNYIHQADAAALIAKIAEREIKGVFNLVSPKHPTRAEVYAANSARFGFDMPMFKDDGIKRIIDGSLIERRLGYSFLYPDPCDFYG